MRITRKIAVLLVSLWIGVGSQSLFAQDGNIARAYTFKVKQGQGAQFEEAFKQHIEWRKQAGDPWNWTTYQLTNGQNTGTYLVRSNGHTWGDLDSYAEFLNKGSVEFNETVTPFLDSITSSISRGDPEHQNWFSNGDDVNLISVATYHLKPGKAGDMGAVLDKYHQAVTEHDYPSHYAFVWSGERYCRGDAKYSNAS